MKTRLTTDLRSRSVTRTGGRCAHRPPAAAGFTLVELLVTIGIIALLIGILFPVLTKVRAAGARTKSMAIIHNIAQAVEAYHMQFGAYPGPFANNAVMSLSNQTAAVTSSENLYLGLSGGLYYNSANTPTIQFDPTLCGLGPHNLSATGGNRQYPPFIEGVPTSAGQLRSGFDSVVPEYLDGYGTNMPVLYLRANIGKVGIASEDNTTQYDGSELYPYTRAPNPTPADMWKSPNPSSHGLIYLGLPTDTLNKTGTNNVLPYLSSQTVPGQPRKVDSFILIGAGADGIYGTADDITSFGDVMP